jgi:Flp pilus assembly protein TadG
MTVAQARTAISGKLRRFARNSRGNATMIATLAAIPMVACAGLAIDYLRGIRSATELQQVTDAAALAAASAKNVTGTQANQMSQRATIASNYINASIADVKDVEIVGSPSVVTGPNTIDVTVNAKVKGSLINVLNALPKDALTGEGGGGAAAGEASSKDINLTVHSKVAFTEAGYICLLALHPTATEAIYFQGNSTFMATCAVQANSNAAVAMRTWGTAEAYATRFYSIGGWAGSGFDPAPVKTSTVKADPYAALALPTVGGCNYTDKQVKDDTETLSPGVYCGGLKVSTHGVANLQPGLYIIKNGKLDVDSQSTLNAASGVTFYLTGDSSYIDIKSGAVVTITAPNSANATSDSGGVLGSAPWKGFAVMQDRESGEGNTNTIYSKGGVNITGAFYTPEQRLVVWANDTMNGSSSYFPMIVDTMNMNGTSTLYVNLDYEAPGYPVPEELKIPAKVFVTQ